MNVWTHSAPSMLAAFLASLVEFVEELTEDPTDIVVRYMLQTAHDFSLSTQYFTSIYLLSHGVIKAFLIVGLLREKLWYYPVTIVVFVSFIVYQLYRFNHTHSIWLLLITLLDIIVIWLTWHEYRYLQGTIQRLALNLALLPQGR
jgi:uncharacterized membrane protein